MWARAMIALGLASGSLLLGSPEAKCSDDQPRPCEKVEVRKWTESAADPTKPYEERVASYRHAIRTCPQDPSAYSALAELLLERYQFDEAQRWIQEGLKSFPDDPQLNLDRAATLLLSGQTTEALSILNRLPPSAKSKYYAGLAYRTLKDRGSAQAALREAWDLGYHDPFLLYALVEQDRLLKDYAKDSEDLRTLREQFPNSPWPHMAAGDELKAKQKRVEAEAEYKEAQKLDPNLPFLNYRLGDLAYGRGENALAETYFRKEIALNPTYPAPYVFAGICLHRQGKNSEALPFLKQGLARAPDAPLAYLELAMAEMDLNQLEEAKQTLETARRKFPDMYVFPAKLSRLLSRMGQPEEAKAQAALAQQLGRNREKQEQQLLGVE